ncbi:hypothetical protein ACVR1G_08360 [Streptococcus dentasini]
MTRVRELIQQLQTLNPEAEVILTIDNVFIPMDYGNSMIVESDSNLKAFHLDANQRTVYIKGYEGYDE